VVHDVRGRASEYSLDKNGFTYLKRTSKMEQDDFTSRNKVEKVFPPELETMLKESRGSPLMMTHYRLTPASMMTAWANHRLARNQTSLVRRQEGPAVTRPCGSIRHLSYHSGSTAYLL
jgi:hypothetical protein